VWFELSLAAGQAVSSHQGVLAHQEELLDPAFDAGRRPTDVIEAHQW
jgi:hypothetical protein